MKFIEKIIIGILTIGLLAALTIGGSLAYMTDWENKSNNFTVGTLDISLEEKNWDIDEDGEDVVPGDTFLKDPVIEGVRNDSYVRTYIIFKDASGAKITNEARLGLIKTMIRFDSTYNAETQTAGNKMEVSKSYSISDAAALPMVNPLFTLVSSNPGEYCYTYNSVLKEGDHAVLFTNVFVPTDWSQIQLDIVGAFSIDVVVEAIQAKNFANGAEAFAALDNEISAGTLVKNYDSTR